MIKTKNNNILMISLILISLAAVFIFSTDHVSAAPGDQIYVNGTGGSDSNNGYTWATAKRTIGNATGTVNSNGNVTIANGTYSGTNNRNININKNVTIAGVDKDGVIIDVGTENYKVFTIQSGYTVNISNLTIRNGTANNSNGGAIQNVGTLTVTNCNFSNNKATRTSGSNGNGGAIYSTNSLTVTNSSFTNNSAVINGGAIYIGTAGTLTVNNCTFTNNNVTRTSGTDATYGGAIYSNRSSTITNSIFTGNRAISGSGNVASGGAIYLTGTTTINGSTFTNNSANSSSGTRTDDGGAIYSTASLTVNNSNFTGNNARNGGAILATNTLNVENNSFVTNSATANGGAIYKQGSSNSNVTGSNFQGNTATSNGGAFYNTGNGSTATLNFNRIIGNKPANSEIYRNQGTVNAQFNWWGSNSSPSGKVSGNPTITPWLILTVTASPSAIPISGTSTVTADLLHDSGTGNPYHDPASGHVPDGIQVKFGVTPPAIGSVNPPSDTLTNGSATTTFTANSNLGTATVSATADTVTVNTTITIMRGDVYVSPKGSDTTGNGSLGNPYLTILTGYNNVAPGGNIHILSGTYTGVNNRGITISKNVNILGEGGTVTIDAGSSNRFFTINNGYSVTLSGLTFTNGIGNNNNGYNGGAIQNNGDNLTLNNCNFTNNMATRTSGGNVYGGAIYNTGTLNITKSTFTGNNVVSGNNNDAFGGAIYSTGPVTITSSNFTNNKVTSSTGTANDDGGAIYTNGNLTITGSTFTSNIAGQDGGAIYSNSNLNITDSIFTSNTAAMNNNGAGGAICIGDTSILGMSLVITNSTFSNNSGMHGSALWTNAGTTTNPATITNSNFTNNNGVYGTIRNWGTLNITGSTFTGNIATNNGGALSNYQGTATLNFNRIVGNSNYEIYRENGSVNAVNNWWGSNSSPSGKVNSGVTVTTWLILSNMNASPNLIRTSGTSTVTVDLTHDNTGANHDPASGHVPDGILVNFTGTLGTILNASTVNGRATTTFKAGSVPGIANVQATVDNVSINTTIIIYGILDISVNNYPYVGQLTWDYYNTPVMVADIKNNGPDDAINVVVEYVLPNGVELLSVDTRGYGTYTYDPTTRIITWYIGTIPNGGNPAMNVCFKLTQVGNQTTIARLKSSDTEDNNSSNNSKNRTITVLPAVDIQVNQTINNTNPHQGDHITITITTKNNGPNDATNVTVNDILPTGLTFSSYKATTGTYDPTTGTWTIGNLTNGTNETLTIIAQVTGTGTITNKAYSPYTLSQIPTEWNKNNNSQTVVINASKDPADISVNNYPYVGQLTWDYYNTPVMVADIKNNGPDDAINVVVEYVLPNGVELLSVDTRGYGTYTYDPTTRIITWYIGTIPNGGNPAMNVCFKLTQVGNQTTIARLKSSDTEDNNSSNNSKNRTITVLPAVDIQVNQTINNTNPHQGDHITITITTKNNGPNDATNVTVNDILPTGLTFSSYKATTGTYDPTTGTWTIGNLTNGTNETLTIIAQVTGTGTITNKAYSPYTLSQIPTEWNKNNNSQTVVINVA